MIWWPLWIATIVIAVVTVVGIIGGLVVENFRSSRQRSAYRRTRAEKSERWETLAFFTAISTPALVFVVWDVLSLLGL